MNGCRRAGDSAGGNRPVMGSSDLDPQSLPVRSGVDSGGEGSQGFSENHMSTAMQDAGYLGVAFDGHGSDHPLGGHFHKFDAHPYHEGTDSVWAEPLMHVLRHTGVDQFLLEALGDGRGSFLPGEIVGHEN